MLAIIITAEIKSHGLIPWAEFIDRRATGKLYISFFTNRTNARGNSFQRLINVQIIQVARAGLAMGRPIKYKNLKGVQPSNWAASYNSCGICLKNEVITRMGKDIENAI